MMSFCDLYLTILGYCTFELYNYTLPFSLLGHLKCMLHAHKNKCPSSFFWLRCVVMLDWRSTHEIIVKHYQLFDQIYHEHSHEQLYWIINFAIRPFM